MEDPDWKVKIDKAKSLKELITYRNIFRYYSFKAAKAAEKAKLEQEKYNNKIFYLDTVIRTSCDKFSKGMNHKITVKISANT